MSSNEFPKYLWLDGAFIEWDTASLHPVTHSLHYAGAVFEGIKAYNGKVFKLVEHTNRLLRSAQALKLQVKYDLQEINQAVKDLLEKNQLQDAYIRPLIWRSGGQGVRIFSPNLVSHLMIMCFKSGPRPARDDLKLVLSSWRKPGNEVMPTQCKSSGHYEMMHVAQSDAIAHGYDDALFLDMYDYVAECSGSNIFFAKDKTIVTPIADRFLDGITRQTIIEIAHALGFKVRQERMEVDSLSQYDECFITGTAAEIQGVASISFDHKRLDFLSTTIVKLLRQHYIEITAGRG